jgi:hypothetical protein
MKTVTNVFVASLCLGLSGVVYAEPAAMQPTKPVASAPDTAKPKATKHKLSAPTETSAMPATPAAKKSAEHREPALNAAPAAATSKAKSAVPATPASKDAKHTGSTVSPMSKPVPSAEAPKAAK